MKKAILRQMIMLSKLTFYGFAFNVMVAGSLLAFSSNAQSIKSVKETSVSLHLSDPSIGQLFHTIEGQTDYNFSYNLDDVDSDARISGKFNKSSVAKVLLEISKQSGLKFRQVNNNIHVGLKKDLPRQKEALEITIQGQTVTGRVTAAENSQGLPGVNVIVKGTALGTVTDVDGNYKIDVPNDNDILVFSSIGYVLQEVSLNGRSVIDVSMAEDVTALEEIVVVGYGTQKKSDLTGSVASVSPKELVDRPVTNVGQAMQNKVAGVFVIKQGVGVPGGKPMVRIRGTNSINTNGDPLFVVDGIVGVRDALETIDPNDIVSMDILKDASATAIYGTRGANGVVIIETKRGAAGETQVNYSGSVSLATMTRHNYTVTTDQMMYLYEQAFRNTPKFGTLKKEKDFRGGKGTGLSWSEMPHLFEQVQKGEYFMDFIGNDGNYYKPRFYSDWEDLAFNNSVSQDHHIDVSGGTEKAKFSMALGYTDQNGLMKDSYYKRINGRITGDVKINDWLGLSTNISYARAKRSRTDGETRTISETWPLLPIKYPNEPEYGIYAGMWSTGRDFPVGENWKNILYTLDQRNGYYLNNQFTGSVVLNAQITKDLSFKTDFSADISSEDGRWYQGTYQGNESGRAEGNNRRFSYWQNQNYFNYIKTMGDHSIVGLLGLSWSEQTEDYVFARAEGFVTNFYQYNNLLAGTKTPRVESSNGSSALNSYFARLNYSYKGKYMVTATGRYDGSSKFGTNSKYGFFPSIGAAWRISEEDFMAGEGAVSNLKLRASAGQTGNQEIGSYVTQRYINISSILFGNSKIAGLYPGSTGNDDLKWETTTQYNVGLDIGLFNNRVNLVFDVYHKLTTDMLLNVPLPESTTSGSVYLNYGSVKNDGVEVDLSTVNIETANFSWNTHFTLSSNKNEIVQLGPTGADIFVDTGAGNATSVYREGSPIGSFFGLNRMGVYGTEEAALAARYGKVPGDLKFEDVNQDGKIELISDGNIIGNAFPKLYGGFDNSFSYKNFDANITFQFVGGVDKAIVHESAEDRQFVSGMVNRVLDAWRPDHQDAIVAQVKAGNAGAKYDSYSDTHEIYNAAYIRGSVASLGYTMSNKLGLRRLRVYATVENFFLHTAIKLEGYDPEGSSQDKIRSNIPNIDKYQYPNPTTYSLGVNVGF